VRDYSPRFIGTEVGTEADKIERWAYPFDHNLGPLLINPRRVIKGILERVSGWEGLDEAAAFLKQNEIQNGIEESHRELTTCTSRFMVRQPYATSMGHSSFFFPQVALSTMVMTDSESQEREMARQRDHQRPFDIVAVLLEEIRKRGHFITSEAPQSREQFLQVSLAWLYYVDA
jgi:hypothetical protein